MDASDEAIDVLQLAVEVVRQGLQTHLLLNNNFEDQGQRTAPSLTAVLAAGG